MVTSKRVTVAEVWPHEKASLVGKAFKTEAEARNELAPDFVSIRVATSVLKSTANYVYAARADQIIGHLRLSNGHMYFCRQDIEAFRAVKDHFGEKTRPKSRDLLLSLAGSLPNSEVSA